MCGPDAGFMKLSLQKIHPVARKPEKPVMFAWHLPMIRNRLGGNTS
jgi:hypothetical protein